MGDCTNCRYAKNMGRWPCDDCVKGDKWEEKPLTNADTLRAMSDEEIENWFWWMHQEMMRYTDSRVFLHDWLRQEVSDGRN